MYENMITIEDVNTVLAINPHFNQLYCIDTGNLPSTAFTDTYYDFNVISMTVDNSEAVNKYVYRLEVYNRLWDGGISFRRLTSNPYVDTETEYVNSNGEHYVLTIKASSTDFDIMLHLNNDNDSPREILTSTQYFALSSDVSDFEYYYYESETVDLKVLNVDGTVVNGANVKVKQGNTILVQGNTNSQGEVSLNIPSLAPNSYNVYVEISKTNYATYTQNFNINILKETPSLVCSNIGTAYKGGYSKTKVQISTTGTCDIQPRIRIQCASNKFGSTYSSVMQKTATKQYSVQYDENLRGYRGNNIILRITVEETPYTSEVTYTYTKTLSTFVAQNWSQLKQECENTNGVDYIQINQGRLNVGATINTYRDIEITGELGLAWAECYGGTDNYLFKVHNSSLLLYNIAFNNNSDGVLFGDEGSWIRVENCYFLGNSKNDNKGVCIKNPIDSSYHNRSYFEVDVINSTFENNKGCTISSSGGCRINNNIFIVNSWSYCQHPQAFALSVQSQIAEVNANDFVMDLNGEGRSPLPRWIHSNFSWGSKPFYIHEKAYFNGRKGSSMIGNNKLNHNDNQGYIYALYEYSDNLSYWYDVSASAVKGKERQCFGYIISSSEISYWDGLKISTGTGNTSRKPTYHSPTSSINKKRGWIE